MGGGVAHSGSTRWAPRSGRHQGGAARRRPSGSRSFPDASTPFPRPQLTLRAAGGSGGAGNRFHARTQVIPTLLAKDPAQRPRSCSLALRSSRKPQQPCRRSLCLAPRARECGQPGACSGGCPLLAVGLECSLGRPLAAPALTVATDRSLQISQTPAGALPCSPRPRLRVPLCLQQAPEGQGRHQGQVCREEGLRPPQGLWHRALRRCWLPPV